MSFFVSPAWVGEPDGRGSWGVVQSCLVSLFFCIYQPDFSIATSIRRDVSKPFTGKPEEMHFYTMNQASSIVAGGLAIETKSFRQEPYLTVTPVGAVKLARLGLLKPVLEEMIKDKTKADSIIKMLLASKLDGSLSNQF